MTARSRYIIAALVGLLLLGLAVVAVQREAAISSQGVQPIGDRLSVNWYHGAENIQPVIDAFTTETGIPVEVIDSYDLYNTDVMLISDFGTLLHAKRNGYLSHMQSEKWDNIVPEAYRDRDGLWYGVLLRARTVVFAPDRVNVEELQGWEDLADEKWQGRLALRQSDNIYNRSLVAMMIRAWGPERTEHWIKGIVANATDGPDHRYLSDTSNLVRVAEGDADLTFANTYYMGYMLFAGFKPDSPRAAEQVAVVWFDDELGTPVNVTGVGINPGTRFRWEAERLVDFLLSPHGQALLSEHTYKYPIRDDIAASEWLNTFGDFRKHTANLNELEPFYGQAIRLMEENGWRRVSDDKWPAATAQERQRQTRANPVLYPEKNASYLYQ